MPDFNHPFAARPEPDNLDLTSETDLWTGGDIDWPKPKERITVRLDQDVLNFFRRGGKGYQTRMNAVLRAYIKADRRRK